MFWKNNNVLFDEDGNMHVLHHVGDTTIDATTGVMYHKQGNMIVGSDGSMRTAFQNGNMTTLHGSDGTSFVQNIGTNDFLNNPKNGFWNGLV